MNQSETKQIISKIEQFLKTQPVRKAWLFGSFAREEATPDSDVDLLVQLDYKQIITGLEFFQLWEQLEQLGYCSLILSKKCTLRLSTDM